LVAMYNVVDLIARYIPLVSWLKLESRKGLLIAILSRFLLVPAFYFTAKYGDQGWMIFLTSFLGLTNGYLTVCVMSYDSGTKRLQGKFIQSLTLKRSLLTQTQTLNMTLTLKHRCKLCTNSKICIVAESWAECIG
jgi:hypothetical protein